MTLLIMLSDWGDQMRRHEKLVVAAVKGVATVYRSYSARPMSLEDAVAELPSARCIYTMCDRSGYGFLYETLADLSKEIYWFDLKAFGRLPADLLCHAMLFPSHKYTGPSAMVRLKDDFRDFLRSALHCRTAEDHQGSVVGGIYDGSDKFHSFVEFVSDTVSVQTVSGKKCLVELFLKLGHPNWTVMQAGSDSYLAVRRLKVHAAADSILSLQGEQSNIDHPLQYVIGLYRSVTGKDSDLCKKDVNAMRKLVSNVFKLYRRQFCE